MLDSLGGLVGGPEADEADAALGDEAQVGDGEQAEVGAELVVGD
jgi:hypothetical protein